MSAADQVQAFTDRAIGRADAFHKKIALELFRRIVLRTPVDTGRLRGNWQAGAGVYETTTTDGTDPGGQATIGAISATVLGAGPFVALTLTNNLPYAVPIEYGHSQQAPAGMVRVSVAEFQGIARVTIQENDRGN